jgi:predicted nucleotidyltransferase component of viral defense system
MKKPATNVPSSILARLKNIAEKENLDFNFLLLRYCQERFLARLAASAYVKNFVLKGGFLLLAYNIEKARTTKDIDFLGVNVTRERRVLERIIQEIATIVLADGVEFLAESIKSEEIKEEAEYSGVRMRLPVRIGTAKNTIQLDFAFGDAASPKPRRMEYPTLLEGKGARVFAYSKETIIAEKFEAIVKLTTFNSRMKDFYDIVFLANGFDFSGAVLQSAIGSTFDRRQTNMHAALEIVDSDYGERQQFAVAWEAFKKRTKIVSAENFKTNFAVLCQFLAPVVIAQTEGKQFDSHWDRKIKKWKK